MKVLFIFFLIFILLTCWVVLTTTIMNNDNKAKTFKVKTIFFWIAVIISFIGGYYLIWGK